MVEVTANSKKMNYFNLIYGAPNGRELKGFQACVPGF